MKTLSELGALFSGYLEKGQIYASSEKSEFFLSSGNDDHFEEFENLDPVFYAFFNDVKLSKKPVVSSETEPLYRNERVIFRKRDKTLKIHRVEEASLYMYSLHSDCVVSTISFASFHHVNHRLTNDNTPYINFLVQLANILNNVASKSNNDILNASLLSGVLEHTHLNIQSLQPFFNENTLDAVKNLAKVQKIASEQTIGDAIEHLITCDNEIKSIILARRIVELSLLAKNWNSDSAQVSIERLNEEAKACKDASDTLYAYFCEMRKSIETKNPIVKNLTQTSSF